MLWFPLLYHLPELAQTQLSAESVMPFNHLVLCRPLLLLSIFSIRVFSNESHQASGKRGFPGGTSGKDPA